MSYSTRCFYFYYFWFTDLILHLYKEICNVRERCEWEKMYNWIKSDVKSTFITRYSSITHTHTDPDTLTETGEQREEFIFMRWARSMVNKTHSHSSRNQYDYALSLSCSSLSKYLSYTLSYTVTHFQPQIYSCYFSLSLTHSRISLSQLNYNQFSEIFFSLDDKRMYVQMIG